MITLTSYFCLLAFCFPDYSQNIHKMHVKNTKVSLDHIPDTENSWVLSHDRMKNEELENIANAIKIFEHLWNKKFGINTKVEKNLQNIFIEIGRKYIYHRVYSERNKKVELTRVKGLTTSKNTIWVKLQKNEKVCESSIFHELNHASIWTSQGTHGDPDHSGNKWSGWDSRHDDLIKEASEILCITEN